MTEPNPSGRTSDRAELGLVERNPATVRGVIVAILSVLAAFGVRLVVDDETLDALAIAGAALIPLVQAVWTRYGVTPNAKVIARVTTDGDVVAGDASPVATGASLPSTRSATGDELVSVPVKSGLVGDPPRTY